MLAEDILHTAYERILSRRARFERRAAFKTFVFGVIRNTAREHLRKRTLSALNPFRWKSAGEMGQEATPAVQEARIARAETSERLGLALARLPARQRQVLHLVFYDDMTIAEASAVLDISVGSARVHYDRAKRRLKKELLKMGVTYR